MLPTFKLFWIPPWIKASSRDLYASFKFTYLPIIATFTNFFACKTVLVIFFSNKIVILLFGEAFSSSAEILQVLAAFSIVDLTTRPYSTQMISTGYGNLTLVAGVICSVTHLVLNLVFIPETFLGYQLLG